MDWLAGPIPSTRLGTDDQRKVLRCVAGAGSCAGVAKCVYWNRLDCDAGQCSGESHCEGATKVEGYDSGAYFAYRCDNINASGLATCLTVPDAGTLTCGQAACDGLTYAGTCVGNTLYWCDDTYDIKHFENCQLYGATCGGDGTGNNYCWWADCTYTGSHCIGQGMVETCYGAEATTFDCRADLGLCEQKGEHAHCVWGTKCNTFDPDVNVCSNDLLHVCIGGKPLDYDCTKIGQKCIPGIGICGEAPPSGPDAGSSGDDAGLDDTGP
jgi:hypothetical protein